MPADLATSTSMDVLGESPLSFRAIFGGWLIAVGIAGLLYVAGLALGFSGFNAWDAADSAKTIGIGTAVWLVLTWAGSLFLGAMFASWFDGRNDNTTGAVHGVAVWGLSMVTTAIWISFGLSNVMTTHGFAHPQNVGRGHSTVMSTPAVPAAVTVLDANINRLISSGGTHDRDISKAITAALIAGQQDTATALLAAESGASQAEAATSLARLAPEVQSATRDAKTAADVAAHYAAATLWIAFISALLALITAAVGGWLGAGHVHRVYHLRKYATRPLP